ncbi:MAG: Holliday junction resolvase RuvX [Chloroflexota bacterium]
MGLDIGDRRIGVALSDTLGILATPFTIIERRDEKQDISVIIEIIDQNQVGMIIAGLPLVIDGGIGQQAAKVKAFVEILARRTQVPIEFRDESLTTVEARRIMLTSRSKKNRQRSRDDDVAAAVLLQAYLEERRSTNEQSP